MKESLTPAERDVLVAGLGQWGGPARMTDEVAKVIGFESARALYSDVQRIRRDVEHGDLSPTDARRALMATEFVFVRDVIGAGVEWETVTGMPDDETLPFSAGYRES